MEPPGRETRIGVSRPVGLHIHVTDPSTRYRLRKALSQTCQREALRRGGRTA
jgi:hypothetical protein